MGSTTLPALEESSLRIRKMFVQAMLAFVLVFPLASANVQTDMIEGHYKYKSGDGIEKYYGLWGIPAEVVAEFTKVPYVEVWGLNQESGFSVHAMRKTAGPNGEKSTSKHEWTGTHPSKGSAPSRYPKW